MARTPASASPLEAPNSAEAAERFAGVEDLTMGARSQGKFVEWGQSASWETIPGGRPKVEPLPREAFSGHAVIFNFENLSVFSSFLGLAGNVAESCERRHARTAHCAPAR
jgi:hypothetical protein